MPAPRNITTQSSARTKTSTNSSVSPRSLKKRVAKTKPGSLLGFLTYNKKLTAIFVLLFVGVGVFVIWRSFAATPQGTYMNWTWQPPADGFSNLQHSLTVEQVSYNATYFWSHQFKYVNGDGGYIGLQSAGSRVNGTNGKTAVFSVFNSAIAGTQGSCSVEPANFDGGTGGGTSCRIAYDWSANRRYSIKVQKDAVEDNGTWWIGTVTDTVSGVVTEIGRFKVPPAWKGLGDWSVMWSEYFGERPGTCEDLPYSRVRFSQPIADGRVIPVSSSPYLTETADCRNSKVTRMGTDNIQEMGNNSAVPALGLGEKVSAGSSSPTPRSFCKSVGTKSDGSTKYCTIFNPGTDYAYNILDGIGKPPVGATKFCFGGVASFNYSTTAVTETLEASVGNRDTGYSKTATFTVSHVGPYQLVNIGQPQPVCVSTTGLDPNNSLNNYAQIKLKAISAPNTSARIFTGSFQ